MPRTPSKKHSLPETLERLCPDIAPEIRRDFIAQVDREYASLCTPKEIATHLTLLAKLDTEHLVECLVTPREQGVFGIIVVAFDYFSELSILCGLLVSFGLDIQAGHIATLAGRDPYLQTGQRRGRKRAPRPQKKIVDVFRVRASAGTVFDQSAQQAFREQLRELILLLEQDRLQEARVHVNRRVVEHFTKTRATFMGPLYPIQVTFDNRSSTSWTVMEIRSKDTPGFLYAFSNALSLRRIYIHQVAIESVGSEARDRLWLCDSHGRKIATKREQDLLRIASVMVKQFTHSLASAPDPARAMLSFDQFLDKLMERATPRSLALLKKQETRDLLARLLGSSQFLWEDFLRMQFENLLPVLRDFKATTRPRTRAAMQSPLRRALVRGRTFGTRQEILNRYKDREMFRIDMAHFLKPSDNIMDFSRAVTDLADVVLEEALFICRKELDRRYGPPFLDNGPPCLFAICGLGKFGGREMGYASDIEILCVYGGPGRTRGKTPLENSVYFEELCQEIRNSIRSRQEGIFHIDLRLRPHGSAGALTHPLDQVKRYYSPSGEAAPFERQALIKLRWVAGDEALGRDLEVHRDHFVYSDQVWDLDTAVDLRRRQVAELVKPGTVNAKYSRGGVIDIEYAVQYLQIMHGKAHAEPRTSSTLEAIEGLCRVQLISRQERDELREAYLFLRALIDGLRIVRGNARDLVLPEHGSDEMKFLARRLGYWEADWDRGAARLEEAIGRHMTIAHRFFASRFEAG